MHKITTDTEIINFSHPIHIRNSKIRKKWSSCMKFLRTIAVSTLTLLSMFGCKNIPTYTSDFEQASKQGEFKHEVRQFQKPYDNQQAEQISLMV